MRLRLAVRSGAGLGAALALAAVLQACGGGGGGTAPPVAAPTPAERYVMTHQAPLASLVDATRTEDLAPLAAHVAGRRIVQLGESTHGSREMNQVKVRLIQYLHAHHGFDVIAFESSAFGCNLGREREPGMDAATLLQSCLFGVWHTEELLALFEYLLSTQGSARPLRLAGFDVQFSAPWYETADRVARQLSAADAQQPQATADLARRAHVADAAAVRCYQEQRMPCPAFDAAQPAALRQDLQALTQRLQAAAARDPSADPRAALTPASLASLLHVHEQALQRGDNRRRWRDEGMAANLTTLARTLHDGRRILVWAHNTHIATDHPNSHYVSVDDRSMGMVLKPDWGAELYTLGLYMLGGTSANNDRTPIAVTAHTAGSLEGIVGRAGRAPLFLPFTATDQEGPDDDWLHRPIETKMWGAWAEWLTPARAYDGVLVIDQSSLPRYLH